ncbi:DUF6915 family protein [Bradyrhizobium sp. UFLA06-06]
MRPYQHAISSARALGGRWQDYLAVHEFLDSTKAACADMRHRMILHSVDFGTAIARTAFPDRDDVDQLVRQHVVEDLGESRTLSDWLRYCRRPHLPRFYPEALPIDNERIIADETSRSGISHDAPVRQVCALLLMPLTFASDFGADALCVLGNSFGPGLVRRLIGPPIDVDGKVFDPALSAERIIFGWYRAVPPMVAVVHTLRSRQQLEVEQ